jgi:hypothetical protein
MCTTDLMGIAFPRIKSAGVGIAFSDCACCPE